MRRHSPRVHLPLRCRVAAICQARNSKRRSLAGKTMFCSAANGASRFVANRQKQQRAESRKRPLARRDRQSTQTVPTDKAAGAYRCLAQAWQGVELFNRDGHLGLYRLRVHGTHVGTADSCSAEELQIEALVFVFNAEHAQLQHARRFEQKQCLCLRHAHSRASASHALRVSALPTMRRPRHTTYPSAPGA